METVLKYHSNKIKINISNINSWNDLIKEIKSILKIEPQKEIDVYVLPENTYLKESNFEELFLNKKKSIKGLSVIDVIDLEEKIKNLGLGNDIVPVNKIQDNEDSFENSESIILNKNQIFDNKCNLCKHSFNNSKFGCLLCPNYFLCSICEEKHPHPMIKYKSNNLSDNLNKIIAIYSYSDKKNYHELVKKKLGLKEISTVQLRTNIASNSFSMGSNQERHLNLLIKNNNKFSIPQKSLSVLILYQYDLNITIKDEILFNDITAGNEVLIPIYIRSNEKNLAQNYVLKIEVVSNNMEIISQPIEIKIRIKDDIEDDELNKQFSEYPSIILLPKDKKKKLQYIIKEKLSIKTTQEIKDIMERFKWNIDQAIIDLTT